MQGKQNASRNGRQLSAKGLATREAIIKAAKYAFKINGYYHTSVSEITRGCGVSLASFYQYFKNKEQLLLEINDRVLSSFNLKVNALTMSEDHFMDRLKSVIRLLVHHHKEHFDYHRILSESELIDLVTIGYYDTIARFYRDFFRNEVQSGHMRPLDFNIVSYGLIGICFFNALDWGPDEDYIEQDAVVDQVTELVLYGISGPAPWERTIDWHLIDLPEPLPLQDEDSEPMTKGEKTRRAILKAADTVFGRLGVNRSGISDITREAGVAQGTFYVHFESKRELVEGFVKYMSHKMRRELHRITCQAKDRRDAELFGMLVFYNFVAQHKEIYRVVPEFEIIGEKGELWYYKKLAKEYRGGVTRGIEKGELRPLAPAVLVRSLMGVTRSICLKLIIWSSDPRPQISEHLYQDIIEFVFFGLQTSPSVSKKGSPG